MRTVLAHGGDSLWLSYIYAFRSLGSGFSRNKRGYMKLLGGTLGAKPDPQTESLVIGTLQGEVATAVVLHSCRPHAPAVYRFPRGPTKVYSMGM